MGPLPNKLSIVILLLAILTSFAAIGVQVAFGVTEESRTIPVIAIPGLVWAAVYTGANILLLIAPSTGRSLCAKFCVLMGHLFSLIAVTTIIFFDSMALSFDKNVDHVSQIFVICNIGFEVMGTTLIGNLYLHHLFKQDGQWIEVRHDSKLEYPSQEVLVINGGDVTVDTSDGSVQFINNKNDSSSYYSHSLIPPGPVFASGTIN